MDRIIEVTKEFIFDTAYDFKATWDYRPNVLIWCVIFGLMLLWI